MLYELNLRRRPTFPHAFAPVQSRRLFHSSPPSGRSAEEPIPAPPMIRASFGTKVSTTRSWSGCLVTWIMPILSKLKCCAPSLDNLDDILVYHLGTLILVKLRSFRKRQQAIQLRTNIANCSNCLIAHKNILEKLVNNFELSVDNGGVKITNVDVHVCSGCQFKRRNSEGSKILTVHLLRFEIHVCT